MVVIHTNGEGILTVDSVEPTVTELFPQQYVVKFYGIAATEQFGEDEEFEVLDNFIID